MNLPAFSLRYKSLISLLLILATAIGLASYGQMSRREDPDVKIALALVVTIWAGASAEQVERFITNPIEDEAQEIGQVERVRSTTRDNISVVFVNAAFESDTDMVFQELRNRLAEIDLPDEVMGPDVYDDFGDVTAMIWALSSETASPDELSRWADRFETRLRRIESVGRIVRVGDQPRAVYIEGPLESFTQYGFSPLTAARIIEAQNVNLPSGYVRTGSERLRLETSGDFGREISDTDAGDGSAARRPMNLAERIGEAIIDVSEESGHPLRVRDVFDVRQGWLDPPFEEMLANGLPALALDVRMRLGHNIVEMGREVRAEAAEFEKTLPSDIELQLLHDQPHQVDTFVGDFMQNLVQGLFVVIVVIFLAMGLRTAGIVAASLPLSVVFTFAVMPLVGVDLEIVSIGAFIVALGMLVDNAIIITENVAVHLQRGSEPKRAAYEGAQEIIVPVVTGTMATVCAFLPLLLLKGEIGVYIRALPIVVSASLIASMILGLTMTPILAAWWMRKQPRRADPAETLPTRLYGRFMQGALKLRYLVILLAVASLAGALLLVPVVGLSFFPEAYRDQLTIDVWLPESASIAETRSVVEEVIDIVSEDEHVTGHAAYVGKGGPRFHITVVPVFNTTNYGQVMVNTSHPRETPAVIERLNEEFRTRIAGARITASPLYMGIPVEAPIVVRITGPDLDVMKGISNEVQDVIRAVPGSYNVRDTTGEELVSLHVEVDPDAALTAGVSQTDVALALLSGYEGMPITSVREGDDEVRVFMRMKGEERTLDNLEAILVPSQVTGEKVPLSAFAEVIPRWQPSMIQHHNGRRVISVLSGSHGRLADDVLRDALPNIEGLDLPEGYSLDIAGEHVARQEAFEDLAGVFALILALLLLMLVVQFNSIVRALVILASVPLAMVGAVFGLLVSGNTFGFMAFLGVVSLAGMVIKNAVVWVEFVDRAIEKGDSLREAVIRAGQMRLRPILLTASTTIGAILPLAMFGGVLWGGMAWAMVFGLALATVLTLVVIPCLYVVAFERRESSSDDSGAKVSAGAAAAVLIAGLIPCGPAMADDAPTSPHPLERYLAQANRYARPMMEAELDLELGMARQGMARASFLPQVGALATATRLDQAHALELDTAMLGMPIDIPPLVLAEQNVYGLGATLTLPLYTGGRRLALLEASRHGVSALSRAYEAVEAGVAFGTAASYVRVLESYGRVRVLEEALAVDERLAQVAREKAEAEMAVAFDVSYAETMAANTERLLAMARSEARQRAQAFNDLVSAPLDATVDLRPVRVDPSFHPDLDDLLPAVENRPEMTARREAVRASKAGVRASRGEALPSVALVGEGGYKEGEVGFVEGRGYWMVTAAMQWNIDPVAVRRVSKARVESRRAAHEAFDTRRSLELELRQAHQLHMDTETILKVAARAVSTAEQGLSNAREAYDAGVLGVAPVLDASRALADAKEGYLRAYYARVLSEFQLRYRAGLEVITPSHLDAEDPFAGLPEVHTMAGSDLP